VVDIFDKFIVAIVMGICLCVGFVIKNMIPSEKVDKFIPAIVGILGVFLNSWLNGFTFTPEIVLGGLVSGLASTGMYEAFHQFLKKG
jgi:hypothetical protein